ncbi:type IV pilus twitching motility protein PilT [Oceanobacillus sp. 1P07AA]|uniref:type IV pilus twitching motility protein PilT n=1 Tax=Oceanobacillus sp. 1P07AA TaxID=3132293 RepID=UPI0039A762D3
MKKLFDHLLQLAVELKTSDIHLTVDNPPIFRVNGILIPQELNLIEPQHTKEMISLLLSPKQLDKFEENKEIDFSFEKDNLGRFRVNAFYQRGAVSIVIRIIPNHIPELNELHLPNVVKEFSMFHQGLVLVTGPTGSGKSTTLASIIDYMNKTMRKHIITLEDPIEYIHYNKQSIINQREIGVDTNSFVNGLRASLRQDPDVILIGEMRDLETISTAITAAETGHLVLGTLHTNDTVSTIERLIDIFPSTQQQQIRIQLSSILQAILTQQLFITKDKRSRRVATEVLINTPAVKNLIRNEKIYQIPNILQTSKEQGMHTFEMDLFRLVKEDIVNPESIAPYIDQGGNQQKWISNM